MYFGWVKYIEWRNPPRRPPLANKNNVDPAAPDEQIPTIGPKDGETAPVDNGKTLDATKASPPVKDKAPVKEQASRKVVPLENKIVLGGDRESGYSLEAHLSNHGAVVEQLKLNDYRKENYRREKEDDRLVLLPDPATSPTFFEPAFALALANDPVQTLTLQNWEVVQRDPQRVVFRTRTRDEKIQIEKRFLLDKASLMIRMEVAFLNLSHEATTEPISYTLDSANGLPVEGEWYTNYFRHAVAVLAPVGGSPYLVEQFSERIADGKVQEYANPQVPVKYLGVVNQYFASVLIQPDDRPQQRFVSVKPVLVGKASKPYLSNIAMRATSESFTLPADGELVHEYLIFHGPKDEAVLYQYANEQLPLLIHYSRFLGIPIGGIAQAMVWILVALQKMVGDYGVAIILLTLLTRGVMFPLSLKQQAMMLRMQEMQPALQEIKNKYPNDIRKQSEAMNELYAKHKIQPMLGCLPIIPQIFVGVGLYQGLYSSFQLRQSTFFYGWTWIQDLSAPDQLFPFWVELPWLGPYFNLLPTLSLILMVVQMRMMPTPPATTPEAEMQAKMQKQMFTMMMVVMGVMFFKIPAGLCVYILASSLLAMAERRLAPKPPQPPATAVVASPSKPSNNAAEITWKRPVDQRRKKR